MRVLDRLPRGTVVIGGGLAINGITAYAFITIVARTLGPEAYNPIGLLWAIGFLLGPGLFQPLEQEVARIVASRGSAAGTLPVVRRAAAIGLAISLVLVACSLLASRWLIDGLFDGEPLLLVGMLMLVIGFGAGHLARGLLAGTNRFGAYSRYLLGDGVSRLALVVVMVLIGVRSSGPFGIAHGLAPVLGILIALAPERRLFTDGEPVPWSELSRAMGSLLAASLATAFLLNVSPLAVQVLADDQQGDAAGIFLNALLIARIPLFFFQAVQASLLPRLSALAAAGRYDEMWHELRHLLALVVAAGGLAVVGFGLLGPFVVETAFGSGFAVSSRDMALLAVSSAGLMIALTFAQALIACRAQGRMALSWVAGVVAFPIAVSFGSDLFLRVELALIVSVVVSSVLMALMLERRLHGEGVSVRKNGAG
jgi:O-antigen/teichoic acid export membrane protein